ncbi:MAG TPA: chitobiase/beta-hexosaminidase C-terminal domain-containing protein [Candidatus Paceibacterota bacterium]|nr:chitobiase/beta-hexosaminidase C-terminal domain-containing protein [Candidatus Paceibacterota bacterium]HPT18358.1 chitobiase/beta-hexosaminidase C-terminal domain-containing protein [Candidatus Paceibacterota bacterium]
MKKETNTYKILTSLLLGITITVSSCFLVPAKAVAVYSGYKFYRNLGIGSTGEDVKELQKFLNTHNFPLDSIGPGSFNNETEYFGEKTEKALALFQFANKEEILAPLGLDSGTGFFGPFTRGFIEKMFLSGNTGVGIVQVKKPVLSGFHIKRKLIELAIPTANISAGSFTTAQDVALSAEEGATIYYTTDNSDPTTASSVYTTPINVPLDTTITIKAFAVKSGFADSDIFSGTYVVTHIVPRSVSGNASYGVTSNNDFRGLTIYLKQNGETKYSTTTLSSGTASYSFSSVNPGTYDLYFSTSVSPGSINTTDAVIAESFISNNTALSGIAILAADVYETSADSIIDSNDSSRIMSYFSANNTPMEAGDFVIVKSENVATPYTDFPIQFASASSTPGFSNMTLVVGDSDITQNFNALSYGDVNGSHTIPQFINPVEEER